MRCKFTKLILAKINGELKNRGISQAYVANKVGMTRNALSRTLAGKRGLSADECIMLCEVLDIDLVSVLRKSEE